MNLIISFSGRKNGNCDDISRFIAGPKDSVVCFRDLNVHDCSNCEYECFRGSCKYHQDDVYGLYKSMLVYDKTFFVVPMYCGNPSSLYFKFNERYQDFFMQNKNCDEEIASRLYIIGVYGAREQTPDFIPCFEKWFEGTPFNDHVLGIERHKYRQKMADRILCAKEVRDTLTEFIRR